MKSSPAILFYTNFNNFGCIQPIFITLDLLVAVPSKEY